MVVVAACIGVVCREWCDMCNGEYYFGQTFNFIRVGIPWFNQRDVVMNELMQNS